MEKHIFGETTLLKVIAENYQSKLNFNFSNSNLSLLLIMDLPHYDAFYRNPVLQNGPEQGYMGMRNPSKASVMDRYLVMRSSVWGPQQSWDEFNEIARQ